MQSCQFNNNNTNFTCLLFKLSPMQYDYRHCMNYERMIASYYRSRI